MDTFQDLEKIGKNEENRAKFVFEAIQNHKSSTDYLIAKDAELYAAGENATISKYQKLLYTMTGETVPDNYTANHKCKSGFFHRFVTQETAYEVGNGVTFDKDETKAKLGKKFDATFYKGVKNALIEKVSFGFFNLDHVEMFKFTEFVPLFDEMTGALRAGIRFWQLDSEKPLMATLYESDGYTEYKGDRGGLKVEKPKRNYKIIVKKSVVDGVEIQPGGNYPSFPIIPLWGNIAHKSELVGQREQIDCYDLIKSGFANDLDDASMIYWTLQNAGGMDDTDLAKFIERMKTVRAAVVDGNEGARAEAHTVEVPYQSREVYLSRLENDLYRDSMALDVQRIAAGNVTATQIQAAYEPLNEKADELEMCLFDFFDGLFAVMGIDDLPKFKRSTISNQMELTQMILSAADFLDAETVLNKLPFLTPDEVEGIMQRRIAEEQARAQVMQQLGEEEGL